MWIVFTKHVRLTDNSVCECVVFVCFVFSGRQSCTHATLPHLKNDVTGTSGND